MSNSRALSIFNSMTLLAAMSIFGACADVDSEVEQNDEDLANSTAALQVVDRNVAGDPNLKPRADLAIVSMTGTGCRPGTATSFYDAESKTGVIQFSEYALDITAATRSATKNCILNLSVAHEKGLAYAVTRVQYRGYANLPAGMKGVLDTDYTFAGLAQAVPTETRYQIPNVEQEPWARVHDVASQVLKWSDCATKRTLTMRTRLTITNSTPGKEGHLDMESIEATLIPIEIKLLWKPCPFN